MIHLIAQFMCKKYCSVNPRFASAKGSISGHYVEKNIEKTTGFGEKEKLWGGWSWVHLAPSPGVVLMSAFGIHTEVGLEGEARNASWRLVIDSD